MPARHYRAATAAHYVVIIAVACAAVLGAVLWGRTSGPQAVPLCTAAAIPERAAFTGQSWYWLERCKDAVDLVRTDRVRTVVASAADIGGFGAHERLTAWSERNGSRWLVRAVEPGSLNVTTLYEGPGPALGVWTDGATVAFLAPAPDQGVRASTPIPSLGPKTVLYVADRSSGRSGSQALRPSATLNEAFARVQVLGRHEGAFLVLGVREGGIPVSVLYRIEESGQVRRLLGEAGHCVGVQCSDGSVLVKARSRESSDSLTACVLRVDPATGRVRVVSDWMPAGGMVAETRRGIASWSDQSHAVWMADKASRASRMVANFESHVPIGLADDRVLLLALGDKPGRAPVAWASLP